MHPESWTVYTSIRKKRWIDNCIPYDNMHSEVYSFTTYMGNSEYDKKT